VAKVPHLYTRGGAFSYRRKVPVPIRDIIGKHEITKSLGHCTRIEAEEAVRRLAVQSDMQFREARSQLLAQNGETPKTKKRFARPLSQSLAFDVSILHESERRSELEQAIYNDPSLFRDTQKKLSEARKRKREIGRLQSEDHGPTEKRLENLAKKLIRKHGFKAVKKVGRAHAGHYRALLNFLRRAEINALGYAENILRGFDATFNNDSAFTLEALEAAQKTLSKQDDDVLSLGEAIAKHRSLPNRASLSISGKEKWEVMYDMMSDLWGNDVKITEIGRERCREFREFLVSCPRDARRKLKGLSFKEIWESGIGEGMQLMAAKTINDRLRNLSTFFKFCVTEQYRDTNPAMGLSVSGDPALIVPKKPFDDSDIRQLFFAPIYTGCVDDGRNYKKAGPNVFKHGRYFVPLLALYHGMRSGECCQLYTSDIQEVQGVWVIRVFVDYHTDKRVKTPSSIRTIPLHSKLIELGFLELVNKQLEQGQVKLFPELTKSKRGYYSENFQSWFREFTASIGVYEPGKTFHSFRHTFNTALINSGADPVTTELILGHSNMKKMTAHYYHGKQLKRLKEAIDMVHYEGVAI